MLVSTTKKVAPEASPYRRAIESIDRLGDSLMELFHPRFSRDITRSDSLAEPKHHHMLLLAARASELASLNHLSPNETELLRIILRSHDLGRHLEALLDQSSAAKSGQWHSDKSVELLRGVVTGIRDLKKLTPDGHRKLAGLNTDHLSSLTVEERTIVEFAVRYHATKDVPAQDGTAMRGRARLLCYILRDIDKLEILRRGVIDSDNPAHDYLDKTGRGVWNQMKKFCPQQFADMNLSLNSLDTCAEAIIASVLHGHPRLPQDSSISRDELRKLHSNIIRYLNSPPRESDVSAVAAQRCLTLDARSQSYAGFMLLHCAMVFDLKSRGAILEVDREDLLRDRLSFLAQRMPAAHFQAVLSGIESFLSGKSILL